MSFLNGNLKLTRRNGASGIATVDCEPRETGTIVAHLEQVDSIIREEIRREVASADREVTGSSRLACLMRSRADVQSAITSLLGACH
ncbi:MAG: hypothetical protein V3R87_13040 [Dehalococcoidia bacterium]